MEMRKNATEEMIRDIIQGNSLIIGGISIVTKKIYQVSQDKE